MHKRFYIIFLLICFAIPTFCFAQAKPATHHKNHKTHKVKSASKTKTQVHSPCKQCLKDLGIDISGYVDGSYNYLSGNSFFISGISDRIFDTTLNGITLHQAAITVAKQPAKGFGYVLNVITGNDVKKIVAYNSSPNDRVDVTQALLQYAIGSLTIAAGKYVTSASAEFINPTEDTNFSRSILFGYATPFTHTGIRAAYEVSKKISLDVEANNGWDAMTNNKAGHHTIGFGTTLKPTSWFKLSAIDYNGEERVDGEVNTGPIGSRNLIDLVATLNATSKLTFVMNYDYATQNQVTFPDGNVGIAVWEGVAGYVNYQFSKKWRASLRGEYFYDRDGYRTGVVQRWKEATATLSYLPAKCLEFRLETRKDWSNVNAFVDRNGITASTNQGSFAIEGIFKF